MSATALQISIIAALSSYAPLTAFVGGKIFDNAPADGDPRSDDLPYITLGPYQELPDDTDCGDASECFQQIDIWTGENGAQFEAKAICGAVKKALHNAEIPIAEPFSIVVIEVEDWRVVGDPNEKISHGIVNLRALIEG